MPGETIGVDMTPRALEFPALVETITGDHNFEIAFLLFSWDATFIQDAMFGCDQYEGGFNMVKYCNEEVDELNEQAKRTFEEEARRELLIQATNIVNDELPVAVLHFGQGTVGYSDRLQNYSPARGELIRATSGFSSRRRLSPPAPPTSPVPGGRRLGVRASLM